jgi:hypothetical protein
MGPWLSERLGQPVIIENRPGAGTNIAVQAVVSSPPDGYTLLFFGASAIVNTSMFENLPFNLQRDIAPVSGLIDYPMVMVAHPSVPAKTIAVRRPSGLCGRLRPGGSVGLLKAGSHRENSPRLEETSSVTAWGE